MDLHTQWTTCEVTGGAVRVYAARPAGAAEPLPTVIVIQEIWGVDAHIIDVTNRFATAGFAAICPDLYSRGGERPAALATARVDALKAFFDTMPPTAWMDTSAREDALAARSENERAALTEALGQPERRPRLAA